MGFLGQALPAIGGAVNATQDSLANLFSTGINLYRYGQGMDILDRYNPQSYARSVADAAGANTRANEITDYARTYMGGASQASGDFYQNRLDTAMGMLEGSGAQERRDINQQYNSLGGQVNTNMAARGLAGTTIMPSMRAGVERQRSDALGGLNERLLQQRLGTYSTLSGQQGQAADMWRSNQYNAVSGAMGNAADTYWRGQMNQQNVNAQNTANRLNWIQGANVSYNPTPPQSYSNLGASSVPPPSYPSGNSALWGPAIGGTITGASTIAAATIINGVCVDERSCLETPTGARQIRSIVVGDEIRGDDDAFHRVLYCGHCPAAFHHGEEYRYLSIRFEDGRRIRLTQDHELGGRPAGQWQIGEALKGRRIIDIQNVAPFDAMDLILEGGGGYYADGMPVASMLSRDGKTPEQMRRREQQWKQEHGQEEPTRHVV